MNIVIRDLSKAYRSVKAVDGFSIRVESGECVALLGPSGCGKTTTLNMVAGFIQPDSGSITIGGQNITRLAAHRRNIGMVFQNYALFPHMTVVENVAYGLGGRHMTADEVRTKVTSALDLIALSDMGERYPRQLSGGQQQRVALARALAPEPSVLLLDEPLSNLDARLRAETRGELIDLLRRTGVTTLLVTHDQEEAMAMASRVAVMKDGGIAQIAKPEELYATPRSEFVARFVGDATILSGHMVGEDEKFARFAVGGFMLQGRKAAGISVGERALYMVRPELIELGAPGGSADKSFNSVPGVIRQRTFLGPWTRYDVATDLGSVMAHSLSGTRLGALGEGAQITVGWKAEYGLLLPPSGQSNA